MNSGELPLNTRRKVILAPPATGVVACAVAGRDPIEERAVAVCAAPTKRIVARSTLIEDCFAEYLRCARTRQPLCRAVPLQPRPSLPTPSRERPVAAA